MNTNFYSQLFNIFGKVFDTRAKKILGIIFLAFLLFSVLFGDIIQGEFYYKLQKVFGALGIGGGTLFLGIGLLRVDYEYDIKKWQIRGLGLILIFAGILFLSSLFMDIFLFITTEDKGVLN